MEQPSSVDENTAKDRISVTPNPVNDNVTISFKSDSPAKITLYSILGEVVYSGTISCTASISTKAFAPGVYHFTFLPAILLKQEAL